VTIPYSKDFAEKFAELIVRECAEISEQSQWSEAKGEYYEGFNEAMIYVSNKIKEHFGVEESLGWVCSKCGTDRTKAVCPLGNSAAIDGRCPMVLTTK
jgi:predicted transposase YbfD/YdcC